MTKAMILALALGAPVGAILIAKGNIDSYIAIPSRFWLGSVLGGLLFIWYLFVRYNESTSKFTVF